MKKITIAVAAMALCASLSAQNINQSVQVTNDYITRFADFQKQGGGLQVPDSLYRFDYQFDYSVFDTPYKGAYEFSPYEIQVTPEARPFDGRTLYLRAGAGYTFHPDFLLSWQPVQREDLTLGVLAGAGGFAGNYGRAAYNFDSKEETTSRGHDLNAALGLDGQYLLPAVRLGWRLGYEGLFAGDDTDTPAFRSAFHSVLAGARAQSREQAGGLLYYDAALNYRHSSDRYPSTLNVDGLDEDYFRVGLSGGPQLSGKYRILLDAAFEMDALRQGSFGFNANLVSLLPHLDFLLGPVRMDAGVRLGYGESAAGSRFTVSPDVTARLDLLDTDLTVFAGVSGGQYLKSLYDVKQVNHFAWRSDAAASVSQEKLRVRAGVDGRWTSRLQYGFEAGYVSYAGALLPSRYVVNLVDYQSAYARAKLSWSDARLDIDGNIGYQYLMLPEEATAFAPAAFTADVSGRWNWQRRIFAGAFLEAASSRASLFSNWEDIPGYANLGLNGEYLINSRWGVWATAGNLLCMAIERFPGYIERGPYLTVGLSLKL
ncbi:MAG: hypothetical protein K5910_04180 [Bacteroidales bacterium]|nr:hypothetical protein [Bacteroidales bacterium]